MVAESADQNVSRARSTSDFHRREQRTVPTIHQLQDYHEIHTVSVFNVVLPITRLTSGAAFSLICCARPFQETTGI